MAVFVPNIPLPTDLLSDSQPLIKDNFDATANMINDDHYGPADVTANLGKHRTVTSPTPSPATHYVTTTDTKLYGMQDHATIGNIQYSRGPSNSVPTPVTCLQSPSAPISIGVDGDQSILTFTGIPYCYGYVMVTGSSTPQSTTVGQFTYSFFWNGTSGSAIQVSNTFAATLASVRFSGDILQIHLANGNSMTNVAWTLQFQRIWTPA